MKILKIVLALSLLLPGCDFDKYITVPVEIISERELPLDLVIRLNAYRLTGEKYSDKPEPVEIVTKGKNRHEIKLPSKFNYVLTKGGESYTGDKRWKRLNVNTYARYKVSNQEKNNKIVIYVSDVIEMAPAQYVDQDIMLKWSSSNLTSIYIIKVSNSKGWVLNSVVKGDQQVLFSELVKNISGPEKDIYSSARKILTIKNQNNSSLKPGEYTVSVSGMIYSKETPELLSIPGTLYPESEIKVKLSSGQIRTLKRF